jgi:hypothetical protein
MLYWNLIIKSLENTGKYCRRLMEFVERSTQFPCFAPCTTMYFVAKVIESIKSRNQFNVFG